MFYRVVLELLWLVVDYLSLKLLVALLLTDIKLKLHNWSVIRKEKPCKILVESL